MRTKTDKPSDRVYYVQHCGAGFWAVFLYRKRPKARDPRPADVVLAGERVSSLKRTKRAAMGDGRIIANKRGNQPCQLKFRNLDGTIEAKGEHTYPRSADPRRSRG